MNINIIYQDNHLIAVDKPAGLLTQPDPDNIRDNLENMAKKWVKETFGKPGNVFLHAVHRLDREVGGIVLFARTSKALSRMNEQMREQSIRKTYFAVVSIKPVETHGRLVHFLKHTSHMARIVEPDETGGKKAVLEYSIIKADFSGCLLEISLITGRYHQIRAQLSAIGCPVAGDVRYGGTPLKTGVEGILLHHTRMQFLHPTTRKQIVIESPIPAGWPIM